MWFPSLSALWVADPPATRSRRPRRPKPVSSGLAVEALEGRSVPATLSISDSVVVEGGVASFTVTLSEASAKAVTVRYQSRDGTATSRITRANPTADYESQTGLLTFAPGETSKTIFI